MLIVGAVPTGLGAATRLQQHGRTDWLLIDQVRVFDAFAKGEQSINKSIVREVH